MYIPNYASTTLEIFMEIFCSKSENVPVEL